MMNEGSESPNENIESHNHEYDTQDLSESLDSKIKIYNFFSLCCKRIMCSMTFLIPTFFSFVLLSLSTFIIIIFSTFTNTNVTNLFYEKELLILSSSKLFTTNWLGQGTLIITEINDYLMAMNIRYNWDMEFFDNTTESQLNMEQFQMFLHSMLRSRISVTFGLHYGSKNGILIGSTLTTLYKRNLTNTYEECIGNSHLCITNPIGIFYSKQIPFKQNEYEINIIKYDYRVDSNVQWYRTGYKAGKKFLWVNFLSPFNNVVSTLQTSFYDKYGTYKGVLSCVYNLDIFNEFLKRFDQLEGDVYLVDKNDGLLLASSIDEDIFIYDNEKQSRVYPRNAKNEMISETASYLHNTFGDISGISEISNPHVVNSRYIISCTSVNVTGFSILFVYVQTYYSVYFGILFANLISIISSICITIFSMLFIIIIFIIISRPLIALGNSFRKVNTMDLEDIKKQKKSVLFEIRTLQSGFEKTVLQLKKYRSFLPSIMRSRRKSLPFFQMSNNNEEESMENKNEIDVSDKDSINSYGSNGSGDEKLDDVRSVKTEFFNRFNTGVIRKKNYLFLLLFDGIEVVFENGMSSMYLNLFEDICDVFISIVKRGRLVIYGLEKFIVSYDTPMLCLRDSMKIIERIRKILQNKSELKSITCKGIVDSGYFFQGVVGSDELKAHSFHLSGNMLDYYRYIFINIGDNYSLLLSNSIDINPNEKGVTKKFIDVMKKDNYPIIWYSLEEIVHLKNDEWMYELDKLKSIQRFNMFNEFITSMIIHKDCKLHSLKDVINELIKNDKDVKRIVEIFRKMGIKKETFSNRLEKTKNNQSVFKEDYSNTFNSNINALKIQ